MFQPQFQILPTAQRNLWPALAEVPPHFVLYGGTALALRLGHGQSVDFDFFSSERVLPAELLNDLALLRAGKVLQTWGQTLTVSVRLEDPVRLSFFGGLTLGRVGEPETTPDGVLRVASLLDLAGTKAAVVTQRAEVKDHQDVLALLHAGLGLAEALAAARALYGESYNPMLTLKSLAYFADGDLHKLRPAQKRQLLEAVAACRGALPERLRVSDALSPPQPAPKQA